MTDRTDPLLHVVFLCLGNICRSPMAERVARDHLRTAGLDGLALRGLDVSPDHATLLTTYVPGARPGSPLPDPWYGPAAGFDETLAIVEAAMPALVAQLRRRTQRG